MVRRVRKEKIDVSLLVERLHVLCAVACPGMPRNRAIRRAATFFSFFLVLSAQIQTLQAFSMDPATTTTTPTATAAATIVTKAEVDQAIDTILSRSDLSCVSELSDKCGLSLRRASDDTSWKRILLISQSTTSDVDDQEAREEDVSKDLRLQQLQADQTPWFGGLEILDKNGETCGYVTFYIAYSSWNGKILHLDRIQCNYDDKLSADQVEENILQILANMAVEMGCARLTWTVCNTRPARAA